MSNYSTITLSELQKLSHKNQVRFALFCAKSVSHLNLNHETQLTIRLVELWLDNKATVEECHTAADAAYATYAIYAADATYAAAAAAYAAYATAGAADAAADAAAGYAAEAAKNKAIQAQREHYNELLHIDRIFEKVALGCK